MSNLIVVSVDPTHADHKKPITLTDDKRYKYCGFRNLQELKDYATHMGKTYSGTSFDECYTMLFGKNATEVANINKERHSKFLKPISVVVVVVVFPPASLVITRSLPQAHMYNIYIRIQSCSYTQS